jgi:hypothetical protein
MERKTKIVYEDAGTNKVAFGYTEDLGDFIRVTDSNRSITINKRYIVSIKEGDF